MSRLIHFGSSLGPFCYWVELNRVEKNCIRNILFLLCGISSGSQDMSPGLSNLLSEASMSKYAKFEAQRTRPSWFIPESWKSILKLHVFAAHVWNLYIQLARLPKTLSIALTILVDLVIALLALSCMCSTNSCVTHTWIAHHFSKRLRHQWEERMFKLQCSQEVSALRGICSDYLEYRKSSHSMK